MRISTTWNVPRLRLWRRCSAGQYDALGEASLEDIGDDHLVKPSLVAEEAFTNGRSMSWRQARFIALRADG